MRKAVGAVDVEGLDSKLEAGGSPNAPAPKVLAAVTLRHHNLRPPLLSKPPIAPSKPKLRQVRALAMRKVCTL